MYLCDKDCVLIYLSSRFRCDITLAMAGLSEDVKHFCWSQHLLYPPQSKLREYIVILMSVRSFVRSFVRPSVRPSQSLIRYFSKTAEQNFMKLSGIVHYMMSYCTSYFKFLSAWFWGVPEQNKDFAIQNMGEQGVSFCEHCSQFSSLIGCFSLGTDVLSIINHKNLHELYENL